MERTEEFARRVTESQRRRVPFRAPQRTWAGRGTGACCDLCHRPIEPNEIEYEVEISTPAAMQILYLHLRCYHEWAAQPVGPRS
jgi:hypothetical protein